MLWHIGECYISLLLYIKQNHFKMYMFGVVRETHAHDYFEGISFYGLRTILLFWKPRCRACPIEDPKLAITRGMQCSYEHFLMQWQPPFASNFLLTLRRIYRSGIVLCSVHKEAFFKIYRTRLYSGYDTSESIFCCRCVLNKLIWLQIK